MEIEDLDQGIRYRISLGSEEAWGKDWVDLRRRRQGIYEGIDGEVKLEQTEEGIVRLSTKDGGSLSFRRAEGRNRLSCQSSPAPSGLHLVAARTSERTSIPALLGHVGRGSAVLSNLAPRRSEPGPAPSWVFSGQWSADGRELELFDASRGTAYRFSETGRSETIRRARGSDEQAAPALTSGSHHAELVGPGAYRQAVRTPEAAELRPAWRPVEGFADSIPVSRDWGLAIGDRQDDEGVWTSGLWAIDPLDRAKPERLLSLDPRAIEISYYFLGNPYLAAVEGKAYWLRLQEEPTLFEIGRATEGGYRVRAMARGAWAESDRLPDLRKMGKAQAPEVFRSLETSRMPAGLYSWRGTLFVLGRGPGAATGTTSWTLTALDHEQGSVLGSMVLPTLEPHLVVVPGPESWALVEKGRVEAFGRQDVRNVLLIPAERIARLAERRPATKRTLAAHTRLPALRYSELRSALAPSP